MEDQILGLIVADRDVVKFQEMEDLTEKRPVESGHGADPARRDVGEIISFRV